MSDDIWDSIDPHGYGPMYFDKAGNPISMRRWGELRERKDGTTISDYARIGLTDFEGGVWVSTVWLGMDHGFHIGPGPRKPVIFETMVFSNNDAYPYNEAQMRYHTEAEAIEGHRRTCDDIEHGRRPWFLEDNDALSDMSG
jgi:hypothetical protein